MKVTREQLRGKRLDKDCVKIAKSEPQLFPDGIIRCECSGMWDVSCDEVEAKCIVCGAYWSNVSDKYWPRTVEAPKGE